MISSVLVSERMNVNSGELRDEAVACVSSSLILSFFFRRSFSVIVFLGPLRRLQSVLPRLKDKVLWTVYCR